MPGSYTINTRVTGEVLTAAKYNADNQKVVDNFEPAYMDDYSSTATVMRTKTDPGELSSESLATSLAGEIERLRYAIYDTKHQLDGAITQWYETPSVTPRNVKSYGAVGDGVTDDTTAFQTAIALGGELLIPPGKYKITNTLTITKGISIRGQGPAPGGINNASTTFPGVTIQHAFSGTLFNILGVSGDGEAGVGTRLENMCLQNTFGSGAGAAGIAIRWFCNSNTYRATWLRIKDVHTEIVTGTYDWTYSFYADGDSTTGFAAGSARDCWIEGGRWYNDAGATGGFYFHCAVNVFMSEVFLNGSKANMLISGSDATHNSVTIHMQGGGGADLSLDYCSQVFMAGVAWTNITTTANTANAFITGYCTNYPALAAGAADVSFLGVVSTHGVVEYVTGTPGFIVRNTDRQALIVADGGTGFNSILRLSKNAATKWNINNNNSTDSLRISSNTIAPCIEIAQSTGITTFGTATVNTLTTLTYSASIAVNAALGNMFLVSATNGTAFDFTHTGSSSGQIFSITIKNTSGGAHGAITFTGFGLGTASPTIANGKNQTLTFANIGGNVYEIARCPGDVTN